MGEAQIYSNKSATMLKANALVSYHLQNLLVKFTKLFHRFIIGNRHKLVALLSVPTSEIPGDDDYGREKVKLLQNVLSL